MAWTLQGLLRDSGIPTRSITGDARLDGLGYDHRRITPGDLFCCWPGRVHDGHDFAADAVSRGAAALLVERPLSVDVPQAVVEEVHPLLGPLASSFFGRPTEQMTVAAITGTNGKTTVTYLLESIANHAGRSAGVIGTVSRRFAGSEEDAPRGTPEAIDVQRLFRRMADAGSQFVAIEATSDGLAAGRLVGSRFVTAGFTNLTPDHLNTHGSMEAYFEAKASLFDGTYTNRAVLNVDDPHGRVLIERAKGTLDVVTYGDDGDISASDVELDSDGSRARFITPLGDVDVTTPLVGHFNIANCLCAFGIATHCGFSVDEIVAGLASLTNVPGRVERIEAGQSFLALVDYAHTPDALNNVLRACRRLTENRLIVVFGCGGDRDRDKRPMMGRIATELADLSIVTSDNPRSEDPQAILDEIEAGAREGGGSYRLIVDRKEAIETALDEARDGDVVVVAGKGHEQGQTFADRTIPFDDAAVVREHLRVAS
ncbi:MAG: UDP-N-acetylmuramoyl-L-alanyl-D-glutamate--2,6-diaminopimelate ligase [Actinomycetota bacterium]